MDKLLRDREILCNCNMTAAKREERYRESCRLARISETLTGWREQQLTDEEMATILSHGSMMVRNRDGLPIYDKPCETFDEILKNMVDELQDMIEFIEYMEKAEGRSIDDTFLALEANISAYNFSCDTGGYGG